jgi:hypothetical protein
MSRFVVVSFAFLGWAFYELSGGADFEPPRRAEPVAKVAPQTGSPDRDTTAAAAIVTQTPVLAPRIVVQTAATAQTDTPASNLAAEAPSAQPAVLSRGVSEGSRLFPNLSDTARIAVASLEGGATQFVTVSQPVATQEDPEPYVEPAKDMRKITGSRVNMRGGPGTIYPVISRLLAGNEVEVLSDSGTGWLRLRAGEGQKVGWVAASLVSKKSN